MSVANREEAKARRSATATVLLKKKIEVNELK